MIQLLDRPIAFHRIFVDLTGSINAALLLSQAVYWQPRCSRPDGWWYKSREDWEEETGMGRKEQEGARKRLRSLGILQEKLEGIPARLWFRIDEEKLTEKILKISIKSIDGPKGANKDAPNGPTSRAERDQQDGPKGTNKMAPKGPTLIRTETTTEITTETTTTPSTLHEEVKSGSSGSNALIFDFSLSNWPDARRQRAEKALEGLEQETAQAVLDELNEKLAHGGVNKPIAWLNSVAIKARSGKFIPTSEIPDFRKAEQHRQSSETQKVEAKSSQLWKDHMADLKAQFDDDDFNRNIVPLRGLERGEILLLQAPNRFVKDWVQQRIEVIRDVIGAHTDHTPDIRISVG